MQLYNTEYAMMVSTVKSLAKMTTTFAGFNFKHMWPNLRQKRLTFSLQDALKI